ncbi:MAG: hypothetical protein ACUVQ6_04340 [Dissulfurimicrobium sp.]|uniref:hypothetical protein n=1 Tax=Dissulfurimicrobium sp. TaxID=2022436 RepID=UPI00404AE3AB
MAKIISELISLLKIKDIIQSEGKGVQGGWLPDWAKPGAEIEGVVLGSKGPLDIISINDQVIRAKVDGHLPVGARVQFRVMDVGVPIKVKLLSVMTQPQGGRQLAMDFLAVKAGIPRISNMLSSLLDALSNYKTGADQPVQPHGFQGDSEINAAFQRVSSLFDVLSYGEKPTPEKVGAFFTLMSAGNDSVKTGIVPLQAIFKDVLDGLIDAKNQNASRDISVNTSMMDIETAPFTAKIDNKQGATLPGQGLKQDMSVSERQNTTMPLKTPLGQDGPDLVVSNTAHDPRLEAAMGPLVGSGQGKKVSANLLSGLNTSGPAVTIEASLDGVQSESVALVLKQSISQDVVQSQTEARLNAMALNASVKEDILAESGIRPPFQSQAETVVKDAALIRGKLAIASQEGAMRPTRGVYEKEGGEVIHATFLKKDTPQTEGRQEGNLSQTFDMDTKEKLLGSAIQGLKAISTHLDAIQNYQSQVQMRLGASFFMVPFWFENAAGFGNLTFWTDGDGGIKTEASQEPVSHLIFDLEFKVLGPIMMHVTLRKDSLNLMVAAGKDVLSDIRAGISELTGIMQGLGYRLEISGIIPIDKANQADFAGPLAEYLDSRSSFHLVT